MIVSWEFNLYLAIFTCVAFNFSCMIFSVFISRSGISPALHFVLCLTSWTLRSIHPLEKVVSKPFEESFDLLFALWHLLNFLWDTTEGNTLGDLVMMKVCHFDLTLNPKRKLLLVNHVTFVLLIEHLKELRRHMGFKFHLQSWQIISRLLAYDLSVCIVVKKLELASTHLATLTRKFEVEKS